jgi:Zn-dependent protease with chaperone function
MVHPSHPFLPLSRRRFLTGSQTTLARHLPLVFVIALLSACATSPQGRTQLITPAPISDVYSDVNMRAHLATAKSIDTPCADDECTPSREFDQQVQQLGARLAKSAFDTYPDLVKRVSRFEFVVAEKEELGSTSNAAGKVVVFRGVQELYFDEQALAFVIAREMGHIIGRHHDENSGTSIFFSVLVGVLFPASNIFHGAALANATSSTTVLTTTATTAASSATSYVGSQVLLASVKPDQLREADSIAVKLLAGLGWSGRDTADILEACTQVDGDSAWAKDFRVSVGYVKTREEEIATASADTGVELPDFQVAQNVDQKASASGLSEMGLSALPALDMDKGNKPVAVADGLVAQPGKAAVNTSEGNAHFEGAEIVAKNEVSISPDTEAVGALTVSDAKLEEQETPAEGQTSDTLTEESQMSDAVSHHVPKMSVRGSMVKKIAPRAGLNRNGSKVVSKMAYKAAPKTVSKVVAGNTRLNLAKATINGKQGSTKKLYASTSSKAKPGMNAVHQSKGMTALNNVKFIGVKSMGVKSGLDNVRRVKTALVKIE